ncbi:MAG TPA: hypothetical protein VM345_19120 [Acidimicrobiales bacterium]|nr:hypothetical protein [Acidimicrobiales bacterium]
MDRGGWLSSDGGPSPELEAIWGPNASTQAPARSSIVADPEAVFPGPRLDAAALVPEASRASRRAIVVSLVAVGVVVLVLGAATVLRAPSSGPGDGRTISTAAASSSERGAPEAVTEEQAANARAFLERWNAGPSTTMPLGAAGVPLHERPTTTTLPASTLPGRSARPEGSSSSWSSSPRTTVAPTLSPDDPRLRGAEKAAQDFVDAMSRRDCDAFWNALSTRTREFFEEFSEGDEGGASMKDEMCASLRSEQLPKITVRPPARPHGKDGALVEMEADGEVEQLPMLLEDGRWTVDLVGSFE